MKTLMREEKTRFLTMGSKIRHMSSLSRRVQHCVCTYAGIVSCLSQALNIYCHPDGASLTMQDAEGPGTVTSSSLIPL